MNRETEIQAIKARIALLQNKLNALETALILETDPSVKFKLEHNISESKTKLNLEKEALNKLLQEDLPTISHKQAPKFNTHHQYNCNRTKQDQSFIKYIRQDALAKQKLHFFFVHGGDLQEHKGLYKRFVNKLARRDSDFKTDYKASEIIVKDFDTIRFPNYTKEEALKIGISSALMESLNIPEDEMCKVLGKNLAFALTESPDLQALTSSDKVCFFITISETNWNAQLTPEITRWFITHFCQQDLPTNSPHFYFFFAVDYDEDNEEIKEELTTALKEAHFTLTLPELEMVIKKDVKEWFAKYSEFWITKSDNKKVFKKHFESKKEEMYMEEVQLLLLKIINEINNDEKYGLKN